ncbi:hypothetical protein ACD591_01825 [Rufibacter glacialis]|uniref:Uncharacterized protein n=1 Tax=Rufibacter glacialis TaxID=1259555 RepID=A0A5M8QKW7_9BACT|nr:hypothetical protein [Rufibacter glacialis]KAA6435630.1 hypothetical protein FOE74_06725 [Rufibacter glacialis]
MTEGGEAIEAKLAIEVTGAIDGKRLRRSERRLEPLEIKPTKTRPSTCHRLKKAIIDFSKACKKQVLGKALRTTHGFRGCFIENSP